jgi:hypothetical protein
MNGHWDTHAHRHPHMHTTHVLWVMLVSHGQPEIHVWTVCHWGKMNLNAILALTLVSTGPQAFLWVLVFLVSRGENNLTSYTVWRRNETLCVCRASGSCEKNRMRMKLFSFFFYCGKTIHVILSVQLIGINYTQCCAIVMIVFHHHGRNSLPMKQLPLTHPNCMTLLTSHLYSVSRNCTILYISYKWNHTILLHLMYFI